MAYITYISAATLHLHLSRNTRTEKILQKQQHNMSNEHPRNSDKMHYNKYTFPSGKKW